MGLGFGFWGLGFGFWVLGFGSWVLGLGFWVMGFGFGVLGFGFWVLGVRVRIVELFFDTHKTANSANSLVLQGRFQPMVSRFRGWDVGSAHAGVGVWGVPMLVVHVLAEQRDGDLRLVPGFAFRGSVLGFRVPGSGFWFRDSGLGRFIRIKLGLIRIKI